MCEYRWPLRFVCLFLGLNMKSLLVKIHGMKLQGMMQLTIMLKKPRFFMFYVTCKMSIPQLLHNMSRF